ncbi:MAG: hypothetical protein OSA98_22420 [Rubripirellula sp.]|nr:hypothetical protein [Rubripirellula sp.]
MTDVESIDRLLRQLFYRNHNDFTAITMTLSRLLKTSIDWPQSCWRAGCHDLPPQQTPQTQGNKAGTRAGGRPRKKCPSFKKQIRLDKRDVAQASVGRDTWMSIGTISRKQNVAPQTVHDWSWVG